MMKLPVISLASAAVLLALVASAHAERWCSAGPDQAPDHPCKWYVDIANEALESVKPAWSKIEGVSGFGVETCRAEYAEIGVEVTPEFFLTSWDSLPEFVAGVPVRISANFSDWLTDGSQPQLPGNARPDFEISKRIMDGHRAEWNQIPGVLDFAAVGCGTDSGCKIGVLVQPQLLETARDRIPDSVEGQRIVLIPYAGGGCWD
jgi:hypothetical protein